MKQIVNQLKWLLPIVVAGVLSTFFGLILPSSTPSAEGQSASRQATVHVKIERVEALEDFDDCELDWLYDCKSPADLQIKVTINGHGFERGPIKDQDIITPEDWLFSLPITISNERTQLVEIVINLSDNDEDDNFAGTNPDDVVDINPGANDSLYLTINLMDCIEEKAGAVDIEENTTQGCNQSITTAGIQNNPARITFRIIAETPKDTLIVKNEAGDLLTGAEIWHFRDNTRRNTVTTTNAGQIVLPCLQPGDELIAMQLMSTRPITDGVHQGWHYRTYLTSLAYDATTGEAQTYVVHEGQCATGPIELVVKKRSPLVLFNLVVSIWWAAYGADEELDADTFLDRLINALHNANETLFDVTDGQFAFGTVLIYEGRNYWDEADIQILPSNYMRPWAVPGGITRGAPYTYTSSALSTTVFYPGHIRLGRSWNRGNNPDASLDKFDGSRMIAHEFMHYAFMLFDEYFYFDQDNQLRAAQCPGSLMDDSYGPNPELPMQGSLLWSADCTLTEQYLTHGESAWQTVAQIYGDAVQPPRWEFRLPPPGTAPKPGPSELPIPLTDIRFVRLISPPSPIFDTPLANGTGIVKTKVENEDGEKFYPGELQVFSLRKNVENALRIYDHGTVSNTGLIELVGIKVNDQIVASSWDGHSVGAQRYFTDTRTILKVAPTRWSPLVSAYPLVDQKNQVTGLTLEVSRVGPLTGDLMAVVVPLNARSTITEAIQLTTTSTDTYSGTFVFGRSQAFDEAFIWLGDVDSRKQIFEDGVKQTIVPYTIGGSPDSHKRSNPPRHPASNDGYCQFHFPQAAWSNDLPAIVLSPDSWPIAEATQKLVSAPCYLGVPQQLISFPQPVSLAIYYNQTATKLVDDNQLGIFWWNETTKQWVLINNSTINFEQHLISASIQRPGLYVVMTKPPTSMFLPVIRN
jgi:hypothetical protein